VDEICGTETGMWYQNKLETLQHHFLKRVNWTYSLLWWRKSSNCGV
jgi:hypothetical protein